MILGPLSGVGQPSSAGAETGQDSSPHREGHHRVGFTCIVLLAIAWIVSIHSFCYQTFKKEVHQTPTWLTWKLFACLAAFNVYMFMMIWWSRFSPYQHWLKLCFVSIFVLQFPCYKTATALIYPHHCTFTYYTDGEEFSGRNVTQFNGNASAGELNDEREFSVDCKMKFCVVVGTMELCTHGAREFFALLCHFFPIFVGYTYKLAAAEGEQMGFLLLNMVDVQDFFLLLLEDDLILNYWGKDFSCDEDPMHLHEWLDYGGCAGKSGKTWFFTLVSFWAGIGATVFYAATLDTFWSEAMGVVRKNPSRREIQKSRQENNYEHVPVAPAPIDATSGNTPNPNACRARCRSMRAIVSLIFLDVPFLLTRLWCSYAFGVCASSLLIKNCIGILHSIGKIFGLVGNLKTECPCFHVLLTTIDDHYEDADDKQSSAPNMSCNKERAQTTLASPPSAKQLGELLQQEIRAFPQPKEQTAD